MRRRGAVIATLVSSGWKPGGGWRGAERCAKTPDGRSKRSHGGSTGFKAGLMPIEHGFNVEGPLKMVHNGMINGKLRSELGDIFA